MDVMIMSLEGDLGAPVTACRDPLESLGRRVRSSTRMIDPCRCPGPASGVGPQQVRT